MKKYYCPYCLDLLVWERDEEVWSCINGDCGLFHGRRGMVGQDDMRLLGDNYIELLMF